MAETLTEIRSLTRDLSGQQSKDEITDDVLDTYINNWYRNKLPSELTLGLDRIWRLTTIPYYDKYGVSAEYRTLTGDVRVNGEAIQFYTDEKLFHATYPDSWKNDQTFGTGDAAAVTFAGTLGSGYRLIPETIVIGDTVETFTDDGSGVLTGSAGGTGTVIYSSGAVSATFNAAPADGIAIAASYAIYNESTPIAVLYTNADTADGGTVELVFRPIPDSNYNVEIDYEARPAALVNITDKPLQKTWGDLIAYGTAIDILERYGSFQEAMTMSNAYMRILDTVLSREATVMSNNRPLPRW